MRGCECAVCALSRWGRVDDRIRFLLSGEPSKFTMWIFVFLFFAFFLLFPMKMVRSGKFSSSWIRIKKKKTLWIRSFEKRQCVKRLSTGHECIWLFWSKPVRCVAFWHCSICSFFPPQKRRFKINLDVECVWERMQRFPFPSSAAVEWYRIRDLYLN